MPIIKLNSEVLVADQSLVQASMPDVQQLKSGASENARKRMRLCAHSTVEDRLHEMVIAQSRETYVRPHKHRNKSESVHVIEGLADAVLFDETGNISDVIRLGDYASGRTFYYRLSAATYHTLLIDSEFLVIHEVTNGPFDRADTLFAPWSPEESDTTALETFVTGVRRAVEGFIAARNRGADRPPPQ